MSERRKRRSFCRISLEFCRSGPHLESCSVLFGSVRACSVLLGPARSCSVLLGPVRFCSVLFGPVRSCSVLLGPARSCSVMPGFRSEEPQESEGAGPGAGGRLLVTGATGLLGRSLCRQLRDDGWSVIATGFSRASPRMHRCDLTSEEQVHHIIHTHKPEVIVHCAAERRPDVVERSSDSALNLNVHATAVLAKEAASCGAFLLYISTDYVFDGRNPPYGEDDAPNPLNLYGRSKMEGERETRRHCPDSVILRVPVLFGEVERVSESAVTALWTAILDSTQTFSVDHIQQRFPTEVRDVARVCSQICSRRRQDPSLRGVFHFSGKEQMTKYEMSKSIADAFKLPSDHIVASTDPAPGSASRPQNTRLACSRLELLGLSVEPRPFRTAILDCLWPFTPDRRWRQTVFH